MAKRKSTYEIIFGAVNNTGKAIGDIGKGISGIASPVADAANAILKLDAAIIAMTAGGLTLAIKKFAEYEDVMLKVKGIAGANGQQYEKLSKQTQDLGKTTKFTAKEAADGLQFLTQAGFDVEKAYTALPEVLNLAAASGLELGRTADIVTNIMAGYGIEAKDLAKTNDILTATFTSSNQGLDELGGAFEYVGPVAKALDIPLSTTASLLGKLADAGYKGEKGGTALRNILSTLIAPTTSAGNLFKKLGVNASDLGVNLADSASALKSLGVNVKDAATGGLKPMTDILRDLEVGLNKIPGSADRTAALLTIFGKRGGPQLQALLNQGVGSIDKLEDKIKSLGGVTDKIAKEMESGMGGALRSLNSAFDGFFISIGARIKEEPIDGFKEFFLSASNAVDSGAFDPIFKILNETGERIGNTLKKIAELLPEALEGVDYTGFIKAFEGLSDTLSDAFGVADLTTAEGLQEAIQGIVDTGTSLISVTKGIIEAWGPFFTAVGAAVDSFNDLDEGTKEFIGNLGGAAQQLVALAGGLTVIGISIKAVGFAMSGFSRVYAGITAVAGSAATAAAGLVAVAGVIGAAIGTLIRLIPGVDDLTQSLIGLIDEAITGTNLNDLKVGESEEDLKNKVDALAKYRKNIKGIKDDAKEPIKVGLKIDDSVLLAGQIQKAFEKIRGDLGLKIRIELEKERVFEVKKELDAALGLVEGEKKIILSVAGDIELDKAAKDLTTDIDKIDDKLRELSARRNTIEVVAQINTSKGVVTPNELAIEFDSINKEINKLVSTKKQIQLELNDNETFKRLDKVQQNLDAVTAKEKILRLKSEVNEGKGFGKLVDEIQVLEDGSYKITVKPELDNTATEDTEKKIDQLTKDREFVLKIETEKIKAETEQVTTRIKEQSKIISEALKFKYELDIKQSEIAFQTFDTAVKSSTALAIEATKANTSLFGSFSADKLDLEALSLWRQQVRQNLSVQERQATIQEKILEQTLEEIKLRNQLKRDLITGEKAALRITIDDRLGPMLTAAVKEAIPYLQLWGETEDAAEFLIEAAG